MFWPSNTKVQTSENEHFFTPKKRKDSRDLKLQIIGWPSIIRVLIGQNVDKSPTFEGKEQFPKNVVRVSLMLSASGLVTVFYGDNNRNSTHSYWARVFELMFSQNSRTFCRVFFKSPDSNKNNHPPSTNALGTAIDRTASKMPSRSGVVKQSATSEKR